MVVLEPTLDVMLYSGNIKVFLTTFNGNHCYHLCIRFPHFDISLQYYAIFLHVYHELETSKHLTNVVLLIPQFPYSMLALLNGKFNSHFTDLSRKCICKY